MQWQIANQKLMAKAFSELDFEDLLNFDSNIVQDSGCHQIEITLNQSRWRYLARRSIWGMHTPILGTITRQSDEKLEQNPTLIELLLDLQTTIHITDINLSGLIEEVQQTLFSEMTRLNSLEGVNVTDIIHCSEKQRQKYLDAHPKFIANKGRLGWGEQALAQFAPESGQGFALRYLAVKRDLCLAGFRQDLEPHALLKATMSEAHYLALVTKIPSEHLADYYIMPVHPWQYDRFLSAQFQDYFYDQRLIDLGTIPEHWLPQQSIRTLSAVSDAIRYDIKTSLTILNTSCYRGIPSQYIEQGPQVSRWLADIAGRDPLLRSAGLKVQQEVAGIACPNPYQRQIKGAYRYNEMLGCVWRESAESVIAHQQRPMSMATLMQDDGKGNACIVALIHASELSAEAWLSALFRHVVVPIYHLMCQYGVGIVAHGQNVTLVLEEHCPVGCIIKDFHGDLRLVDQAFPELATLDSAIQANLTRLPPHYLVHDLLTGHFVTVLRFVSPWLERIGLTESTFYGLLAQEILAYQERHPELNERFRQFNLLSDKIDKICLNRVRFKLGLGDSDERPLPELGNPITNPLVIGLQELKPNQAADIV